MFRFFWLCYLLFFLSADVARAAPSSISTDVFVSTKVVRQAMSEGLARSRKMVDQPCRAAIINHHVLAADVMARLVHGIRRCHDLKRVIILSPDHYQASIAPVVTHRHAYRVGDTSMRVDEEGIDRLLNAVSFAREDDRPYWQAEHGVGAIVPFLAQVASSTRILPLVIRGTITPVQSKKLARWLTSEMARGAFVLVSSDMSHYLTERRALANDRKTMTALVGHDWTFFEKATDDFADNGKGVATTMRALGQTSWRLIDHRISTQYGGAPGYTTSYVTGMWK